MGPLDGVRVIDLSQIVSGPLAATILADQGADVVKIEPPGVGDRLRPYPSYSKGGLNAFFISTNRGKRSVCVNLADERGVAVVRRLIDGADVVIQNFRPGVMERLGLGPAELRTTNPRLITLWISGYGLLGPMADRPVFDPVIQAITGHIALQVNPEIPFPDLIRHAVVDKSTAGYAAQAVTAALFHRERTGHGQHIDLSMVDASISFLWPDGMMTETLLDDDVKAGPTLAQIYSLTQCDDGQLVYFAGTIEQRMGLYRALGHPEWCDDERFNSISAMLNMENFETLGGLIANAFSTLSVDDAVGELLANDVPCGLVTALADVASQVQVVANDSVIEFDHPTAGRVRQPRPPARFASTPSEPVWTVAHLGEHTDEVLTEAGLAAEEIADLRTAGIVC